MGSRGAQPRGIYLPYPYRGVSILGLARSPTPRRLFAPRPRRVSILGLARSPTAPYFVLPFPVWFQYLGSRGAQRFLPAVKGAKLLSFNTWAREEPNVQITRGSGMQIVSILGLARSPTCHGCIYHGSAVVSILGLARSPTNTESARALYYRRFNTWAREEPNYPFPLLSCGKSRFNTWAREEPNTASSAKMAGAARFQYLGSRGAQPDGAEWAGKRFQVSILGLARSPTAAVIQTELLFHRFNTWAREEPNMGGSASFLVNADVSILGLARSPTGSY